MVTSKVAGEMAKAKITLESLIEIRHRKIRKSGLSQSDIAKCANVSQVTVWTWANGKSVSGGYNC